MAEGAVATPLTGENLISQGVRRDATAPQQNNTQQQDTLPPAGASPIKRRIHEILKTGITRMEHLAEIADLMLQQLCNNKTNKLNKLIVIGFVH